MLLSLYTNGQQFIKHTAIITRWLLYLCLGFISILWVNLHFDSFAFKVLTYFIANHTKDGAPIVRSAPQPQPYLFRQVLQSTAVRCTSSIS